MTNNKIYFIANWKMYGTLKSVQSLKNVIKLKRKRIYKKAKIVYCPPYTLLGEFSKSIRNTDIELGAQNCHYNFDYGAYTGSVNSKMIKNIGCKYVIIGHSENRVSGENDKVINLLKPKNEHLTTSAETHARKAVYTLGGNQDLNSLVGNHQTFYGPKFITDKALDAKVKVGDKFVDNKVNLEGVNRLVKFAKGFQKPLLSLVPKFSSFN